MPGKNTELDVWLEGEEEELTFKQLFYLISCRQQGSATLPWLQLFVGLRVELMRFAARQRTTTAVFNPVE